MGAKSNLGSGGSLSSGGDDSSCVTLMTIPVVAQMCL